MHLSAQSPPHSSAQRELSFCTVTRKGAAARAQAGGLAAALRTPGRVRQLEP